VTFTVASYNVLATAYIRRRYYPRTPAALLDPGQRIPALAERIEGLGADLLCLQEVDEATFAALAPRLAALGYEGHRAEKGGNRPDGCASFLKTSRFVLRDVRRLAYADADAGAAPSGHVALLVVAEHEGRRLGLANTHLKWDAPETAPARQWGLRQVRELSAALAAQAPPCEASILCGDLNATPDSAVLAALREAGFADPHDAAAFTCNSNGVAKKIDYVLHTRGLIASPMPLPPIDDLTPLPSTTQPSDHLALLARFDWAGFPP
jgi:mRNA deadenylase 3'-5' endonuclease subunit Ccr4